MPELTNEARQEIEMEDVLMVAVLVIAVALLAAYVAFCDGVIGRADRLAEDVRSERGTEA